MVRVETLGFWKKWSGLVAALWAVVVVAGCVQFTQVGELTRLRIGTSGDYAPFSKALVDAPGYWGFDIEVAKAFARDRGYEIEWVPFTWSKLRGAMAEGQFDLAMSGVTVRPDRSVLGRFSVPVMTSGAVLLYRTGRFPEGDSIARLPFSEALSSFDRPGVRVAVNRGGHLERVAREKFNRATVRAIPNNASVREALANDAADVIVTDTLEAPRWREGLGDVAQFGPLTRDRKAYWIAPGRDALARELDAWLLARERDGTLARMRQAAFGLSEHTRTATPSHSILAAIDERLALMTWVAESKRQSSTPIEHEAQELRVLDAALAGVVAAAKRAAVAPPDEDEVRDFYRAQIEAAKSIQRRAMDGPPGQVAKATDLNLILRPALMRIGDRMAQLVVAFHEESKESKGSEGRDIDFALRQALRARDLDPISLARIQRALAALARDNDDV
jgi:cyclohexadienyl dehydratase